MAKQNTSTLNATDKKVIRVAIYSVSTLAIGTALFFGIRAIDRRRKLKKAEGLSLNDNTTQNFAKRLKMAFDNDGWFGTNVESVRNVFSDIRSKEEFKEVKKEYKNLTKGGDLVADLTGELTSTEFAEMQNILAGKSQKTGVKKTFDYTSAIIFAKRFKAGFDYTIVGLPATDKEAIRQVLNEVPTQYNWLMIRMAYLKLYAKNLELELDYELDVFDFSWRKIINQKVKK